jgi:uncharacterized OB-fold protein
MLPVLDPANTPWFTSGAVQVQVCEACDAVQHPPEDLCRRCGEKRLAFRVLPGEGTVESVAIVEHPVHPALVERCPYVVVVVSLDGAPGCNAIGNVLGCEPHEVSIGDRVRVTFEEATGLGGEALRIPQWERVG